MSIFIIKAKAAMEQRKWIERRETWIHHYRKISSCSCLGQNLLELLKTSNDTCIKTLSVMSSVNAFCIHTNIQWFEVKIFFSLAIVVFISAIVPLWPYRCSVLLIGVVILYPPNWLYSSLLFLSGLKCDMHKGPDLTLIWKDGRAC